MKTTFALVALAGLAAAAPVLEERAGCATGVHMIVARASTEKQGEGIIGQVASMVEQAIPGSDSEAVVYPATLSNYQSSQAQGVAAMKTLITDYAARCPESKIALLGYSQGAHVCADTMCGSTSSAAIPSAIASENIVAVIQMGDPSHAVGQPYNVGTSTRDGIFARRNTASCLGTAYTQSYCDSEDTFCDGGNSIEVHLDYVRKYGAQAAAYIECRVRGF